MRIAESNVCRRGFTLVELITTIAVITIIVSLILVGVQAAREASRRTACQNKLRQLAVASLHYQTAHGHFPSNGWGYRWIGQLDRGVGASQPGGWAFQILSMMEISLDREDTILSRAKRCETPISHFRCPSKGGLPLGPHTMKFTPYNTTRLRIVAKTDYAINEGDYETDTKGGQETLKEGDSHSYRWTDTSKANGISFLRSEIRPAHIFDGLSNTYLIGEKWIDREQYLTANDLGNDQSLLSGVDLDINRWTHLPPVGDWQGGSYRQFGSAHAAGLPISFCDGAVRTIAFSVDLVTHARLGNRKDGKSIVLPAD